MTIIEVLKSNRWVSVEKGNNHLGWDGKEWCVEKRYVFAGNDGILYRGDSEQDAVEALVNGS